MRIRRININFDKNIITINKTYHKIRGKSIITPPKTPGSNRIVPIPVFLCNELNNYIIKNKFVHNKSIQKCVESFRVSDKNKNYLKSLKI